MVCPNPNSTFKLYLSNQDWKESMCFPQEVYYFQVWFQHKITYIIIDFYYTEVYIKYDQVYIKYSEVEINYNQVYIKYDQVYTKYVEVKIKHDQVYIKSMTKYTSDLIIYTSSLNRFRPRALPSLTKSTSGTKCL